MNNSNITKEQEHYRKQESIRHRQEEIILLNHIRRNGGTITGDLARGQLSIIRRLWGQNKLAAVGTNKWILIK